MLQIATLASTPTRAAAGSTAPSTDVATPAGLPNADATPTNFLGQLKTALKHLTKAVTASPTGAAADVDHTAPAEVVADVEDADGKPKAAPAEDKAVVADANLPDLLATLGFVLVPPVAPDPRLPSPAAGATGGNSATAATNAPMMPLFQSQPATLPASTATPTGNAGATVSAAASSERDLKQLLADKTATQPATGAPAPTDSTSQSPAGPTPPPMLAAPLGPSQAASVTPLVAATTRQVAASAGKPAAGSGSTPIVGSGSTPVVASTGEPAVASTSRPARPVATGLAPGNAVAQQLDATASAPSPQPARAVATAVPVTTVAVGATDAVGTAAGPVTTGTTGATGATDASITKDTIGAAGAPAGSQPQVQPGSAQPPVDPAQPLVAPPAAAPATPASSLDASAGSSATTPRVPSDLPAATLVAPAVQAQPAAPPISQPPTSSAAVAFSVVPIVGQPATPQRGSQSSDGDDRRQASRKYAAIGEAGALHPAPAADAAPAASAVAPMAPAASPLPVSVQASAVVAQIANQADLYRLPGNKGLRIQLHPEDLGGVLVTVRYSPLGGVELHIDVEHASTGNLVQAGWTDLRNALTSQGISADRLIMNVTTAGNAGPSDFSGGNNNRSDPGSANFSQGSQSGQGQQPGQHQSGTRGWTGPLAGGSALADDNQDVAAVTPLPSRIDYRA
jgi:hypothetical protein